MTHTAHTTEEELKEHISDEKTILEQSEKLSKLIEKSKKMVIFTGAGISTSTGIPDFRGPNGVWTLKAKGQKREGKTIQMLSAYPSPTHLSIVKLLEEGKLKYLVSANVDGIHLKSGVPKDKMSEIHGNTQLEICQKCDKYYIRDFRCRVARNDPKEHFTGRYCDCGGKLNDSIINFGEYLRKEILEKAYEETEGADLILCMGSSLRISPHVPNIAIEKNIPLVIINLQTTPYDDDCALRIFGKSDDLMINVMKNLKFDLPKFELKRKVEIGKKDNNCFIKGFDVNGDSASWFKKIFTNGEEVENSHHCNFKDDGKDLKTIEFVFFGHMKEPNIKFEHNFSKTSMYNLSFEPIEGKWVIQSDILKEPLIFIREKKEIEEVEEEEKKEEKIEPPKVIKIEERGYGKIDIHAKAIFLQRKGISLDTLKENAKIQDEYLEKINKQ